MIKNNTHKIVNHINENILFVGYGTKWYIRQISFKNVNTMLCQVINEYNTYLDNINNNKEMIINILTAKLTCDCDYDYDYDYDYDSNSYGEIKSVCHKYIIMDIVREINKIEFLNNQCMIKMTRPERIKYIYDNINIGNKIDNPFIIIGSILSNRYKIVKFIAHGSSCHVFEGIDTMNHNQDIVIKISNSNIQSINNILSEYNVLTRLSIKKQTDDDILNDNDVFFPKVIDIFTITSHSWSSKKYYQVMVMEMYGYDLFTDVFDNKLISQSKGIGLKKIQTIFKQLAKIINVIHKMNIIHKDIKTENILLRNPNHHTFNDNDQCDIVLIDYGLAIDFENYEKNNLKEPPLLDRVCGTTCYMTPEEIFGPGYNKSVDIFTIGLVIVELYRGTFAFYNDINVIANAYTQIYPNIFNNNILKNKNIKINSKNLQTDERGIIYDIDYFFSGILDQDLIDLLKKCLDHDIKKRITAENILNHQFIIKNIPDNSL